MPQWLKILWQCGKNTSKDNREDLPIKKVVLIFGPSHHNATPYELDLWLKRLLLKRLLLKRALQWHCTID